MAKLFSISILSFIALLFTFQNCAPSRSFKSYNASRDIQSENEQQDSNLTANHVLIDDMLINSQKLQMVNDENSDTSSGQITTASFVANLQIENTMNWPLGVVPYRFRTGTSQEIKDLFVEAAQEWNANTNVNIRKATSKDRYFLTVSENQTGCFGTLGLDSATNVNYLNIDRNQARCHSKGVMMHELGHILGLQHEFQRPDRDKYIVVNFANVQDGMAGAFQKISKSGGTTYGSYDFKSIMHYSAFNLSKNGKRTMVPTAAYSKYAADIGYGISNRVLSTNDKNVINKIYPAH